MLRKLFSVAGLIVVLSACSSKEDSVITPPAPQPNPELPENPQRPQTPPAGEEPQKPPTNEPPASSEDRPSAHTIATRMQAVWKAESKPLEHLDLDALAWSGTSASLTLEQLSPYVSFYATSMEGKRYDLTAEDLKLLSLERVAYVQHESGEDEIVFYSRYNGIISPTQLSLPVSRSEYLLSNIKPLQSEIGKKYMRGILENLSVYAPSLLDYDRTRYGVEVQEVGKQGDDSQNTITFRAKVYSARYQNKLIAELQLTLSGFKPLSDLRGQLRVVAQPELRDYLKRYDDKKEDINFLNSQFSAWRKHLSFFVSNGSGSFLELTQSESPVWTLRGTRDSNGDLRDIYLQRPVFRVTKVENKGNQLEYTLQLEGVNEVVAFSDFSLTFQVTPR